MSDVCPERKSGHGGYPDRGSIGSFFPSVYIDRLDANATLHPDGRWYDPEGVPVTIGFRNGAIVDGVLIPGERGLDVLHRFQF
jgi:hypothetical protein